MAHLHYYPSMDQPEQSADFLDPELIYSGKVSNLTSWKSYPHKHDFCEVMYVAEGQMAFLMEGEPYTARRGDIVICNPGQVHEEYAMGSEILHLEFIAVTGFSFEAIPKNCLLPQGASPILSCGSYAKQMAALFRKVISETGHPQPYSQPIVKGIVAAILSLAMRLYVTSLHDVTPSQRVQNVQRYIQQHYAYNLTLDDLAQVAHVSKYHLAHIFKEHTGMSPVKYLTHCRMKRAKELLMEGQLSTNQIAQAVGYADPQYFRRVFRREVGVPPGAYRSNPTQCKDA